MSKMKEEENIVKNKIDGLLQKKLLCVMENIPVSINGHYGDPLQPDQWDNTLHKLKCLKQQNYKGEVELSTKWIINDEQIDQLYEINPNLWIFCGVTGLGEGEGISLEERFDNYLRICRKMKNTILNIRPIIPGKNDSIEVLKPIIDTVAKGNGFLKHGGYLDPNVSIEKVKYEQLKNEIREYASSLGVKDAPRCNAVVSEITGKVCSSYEEAEPTNLDVLKALGFKFEMTEDNYVKLLGYDGSDIVTKGEVSFARIVVQSSRVLDNWTDSHIYLQMKGPEEQYLACTSSWFHWAREVDCKVNCWYCHVRPGTKIYFDVGDSGCSPIDLYNHIINANQYGESVSIGGVLRQPRDIKGYK